VRWFLKRVHVEVEHAVTVVAAVEHFAFTSIARYEPHSSTYVEMAAAFIERTSPTVLSFGAFVEVLVVPIRQVLFRAALLTIEKIVHVDASLEVVPLR